MAKVISIENGRVMPRPQAHQQQMAANKRHKDAEIIRRWQLRQSVETISRRMKVGTLYVQDVLLDRAILCPPTWPAEGKKAA